MIAWTSNCATCDRCCALEMSPGEFFVCDVCGETRCPKHEDGDDMRREGETCGDCCDVHAEPIYAESLRQVICGRCYADGGPGAGR